MIELAQNELRTAISEIQAINPSGSTYLAVHVRRGDRKPASFEFLDNKIPLSLYVDGVKNTWARLHQSKANPVVYFASDSPVAEQQFSKLYDGPTFSLFTTMQPQLRALASPREYYQKTFDKLDIEYRVLATRGMIVDLAMISGLWASGKELLPEANICSIRYGQNNSLRLFVVNHLQLKCLQACSSWFGVGSSIWQSRRHGQRGSKG